MILQMVLVLSPWPSLSEQDNGYCRQARRIVTAPNGKKHTVATITMLWSPEGARLNLEPAGEGEMVSLLLSCAPSTEPDEGDSRVCTLPDDGGKLVIKKTHGKVLLDIPNGHLVFSTEGEGTIKVVAGANQQPLLFGDKYSNSECTDLFPEANLKKKHPAPADLNPSDQKPDVKAPEESAVPQPKNRNHRIRQAEPATETPALW